MESMEPKMAANAAVDMLPSNKDLVNKIKILP
jgi:hypothetical protein